MYLPEAFLWHVFYFLARACLEFSSGRFRSLAPRTFGKALPGQYLLHNDIKTDNVLLGSPYLRTDSNLKDKNDKGNDKHRCWYPIPKVADFGLSVTTNPEDESASMAQSLQCGTSVWFPPVGSILPFLSMERKSAMMRAVSCAHCQWVSCAVYL